MAHGEGMRGAWGGDAGRMYTPMRGAPHLRRVKKRRKEELPNKRARLFFVQPKAKPMVRVRAWERHWTQHRTVNTWPPRHHGNEIRIRLPARRPTALAAVEHPWRWTLGAGMPGQLQRDVVHLLDGGHERSNAQSFKLAMPRSAQHR